jgi:hypothetical protein
MTMHVRVPAALLLVLAASGLLAAGATEARGIEPADPDLSPEACRLLDYVVGGRDGRILTAISSYGGGPPASAVDGDPRTMWWADKAQTDPQWLEADLGATRRVGGVSVTWWKPYARNFTVQVSTDGEAWQTVATVENKRNFFGDSDLVRFDPVKARYVRLHCTERAVTWQAYCVYEFAVYETLPQ